MAINLDGGERLTASPLIWDSTRRLRAYTNRSFFSFLAMYTAQAAGNIFKKQGPGAGSMIFTASVSAILVNIPQKQAPYNASKAAVVHLAKSLAVEWIDFARVNCISPGFISTDSRSSSFFSRTSKADSSLVINSLPNEWVEKWRDLVPGVRFADPAELKGVRLAMSVFANTSLILDVGICISCERRLFIHDR